MKRTPTRILMTLAATAAVITTAGGALAQSDLEFAVPDVMLLVDTSGSMALTSVRDPGNPARYALPECGQFPASRPVDLNATALGGAKSPPDRWTMLVNVLTGSVKGLSCSAQPRMSPDFKAEFGLGGNDPSNSNVTPYDYDYYLPYNRVVAVDGASRCVPGPSWEDDIRQKLRENAVMWPTGASGGPVYWRDLAGSIDPGTVCGFDTQDDDGLIDQFQQIARFGLMTFDPLPHRLAGTTKRVGTGVVSASNPPQADYLTGVPDTWSYFPNWLTDASANNAGTGWPGGCNEQSNALIEVGARNPAAPPWEGRLIGFGDPMAGADDIVRNNLRVQQALMAMRPYGATPIAGMLQDAAHYLLTDDTLLLDGSNVPYFWGGNRDPGVDPSPGEGCRKRFLVLLTDGGPNLDLRPDCDFTVNGVPGQCPYRLPEESAELLANNNVPVYVIGFAITNSGGTGTSTCTDLLVQSGGIDPCTTLTSCTAQSCGSGQCAYGYCLNGPNDETLAACCTIKGIANKGGTTPFFAEDFGSLYNAFTQILSDVVKGTRSRTQPVFAAGNANFSDSTNTTFAAARFLTSFKTQPGDLFLGNLERERFECVKANTNGPLTAELQPFNEVEGDSFSKNLDSSLNKRIVFSVVPEEIGGRMHADRSIRPLYNETTGDGLGKIGVDTSKSDPDSHMVTAEASAFPSEVNPLAMLGDDALTCGTVTPCCFPTPLEPMPSAASCRNRFLQLQLGFGVTGNADIKFRRQSAFGAILHATPVLVTRPQDFLRDGSYTRFMSTLSSRPAVLYTPTADGQLHAFRITEKNTDLNELWTFMPPAVLPGIKNQFPDRYHASPQALLDGPVIVRDVAGQRVVDAKNRFLKRTRSDILDTAVDRTRWYTILVGSFGSSRGYYALDVTWPESKKDPPLNSGYVKGPRFLWQLTTDADGQPLFGDRSAPPTITTLFFKMENESEPAEHAVALLPGGFGGERSATTEAVTFNTTTTAVDSRFTPRPVTPIYSSTDASDASVRALGGARSLTVVRLDTGEVVRTFRRGAAGSTPTDTDRLAPQGLYNSALITPAPFDAPIMGHVIAYPSGAGAVADRAFVGDAEGRLWRVDLTSVDPDDWSVKLYHDAYPASGPGSMTYTWQDASPLETPPIVSTDPIGRLTIAVSTGDQRTITKQGTYPVWSLTETRNSGATMAHVNWYLNASNAKNTATDTAHLDGGERVTGPMSLFDSILYFTTYDPSSEDPVTCQAGESYLWAVHYVNAGTDASQPPSLDEPQRGPIPWLDPNPPDDDPNTTPTAPTPPAQYQRFVSLGVGSVAFGVGVTQKPACYEVEETGADPFLGYGVHHSISNVTPAQFQLVVQTGRVGDTSTTETKTTKRNLNPPLAAGRVDSWAAILD